MKSEAEFNTLIGETYRSLQIFVRYLGLPRDEVDDMVQETYIKAFKALERYDASRSFKSWLFSIAKNTYIDWTRKQKTKNKFLAQDLSHKFNCSFEEHSNSKIELSKIMSILNEEEQTLIELRFFQKFKFNEIAEFTENSVGSVKMKIRRIIEKMQSGLKKEHSHEM